MCALSAKQEKMAEFLIYRGADVTYEVDLIVNIFLPLIKKHLKDLNQFNK